MKNAKKVWRQIKSIVSLKPKVRPKIDRLVINGKNISNPTTVADTFANFFTNIGPSIFKKLNESKSSFSAFLKSNIKNSFFRDETTPSEVEKNYQRILYL